MVSRYNTTTDTTPITVFGTTPTTIYIINNLTTVITETLPITTSATIITSTKTINVITTLSGGSTNWGLIAASVGAGVFYFLLVVGVTLLIVWYAFDELLLFRISNK